MFSVRHYPEIVTPLLWVWLRAFVKYDDDGRCSCWLATTGSKPLPLLLGNVARVIAPDRVFEGVLLQCYRDGQAVTPCHTDLTGFSFILSLGAPRTFRIHRTLPGGYGCGDYDLDVVSVQCVDGTVLIMDEAFHAGWHHQIVPDPDITEEKLSLVFRVRPGG